MKNRTSKGKVMNKVFFLIMAISSANAFAEDGNYPPSKVYCDASILLADGLGKGEFIGDLNLQGHGLGSSGLVVEAGEVKVYLDNQHNKNLKLIVRQDYLNRDIIVLGKSNTIQFSYINRRGEGRFGEERIHRLEVACKIIK
jgi:hypothetical protein